MKMKDVVAINARSDAPINNTQIQLLSDTSAHFCGETGQAYIFAARALALMRLAYSMKGFVKF